MKPKAFFSILFLVTLLHITASSYSAAKVSVVASVSVSLGAISGIPANVGDHDIPQPALPAARPVDHSKKPTGNKMEELAHIHHFHKERVRKVRRHSNKIWLMSKLLLIICHLALLVAAYLHLTH